MQSAKYMPCSVTPTVQSAITPFCTPDRAPDSFEMRKSAACCYVDGKRTALFDGYENQMLFVRHRWARVAEFLQSPTELKAYLRKHCRTEKIDTSSTPMNGSWRDKWTGLSDEEQASLTPGPRTACINISYVQDYATCAHI